MYGVHHGGGDEAGDLKSHGNMNSDRVLLEVKSPELILTEHFRIAEKRCLEVTVWWGSWEHEPRSEKKSLDEKRSKV